MQNLLYPLIVTDLTEKGVFQSDRYLAIDGKKYEIIHIVKIKEIL